MSTFKVGERALLVPHKAPESVIPYLGATVVVVHLEPFGLMTTDGFVAGPAAVVRADDGYHINASESVLQKLPPPREDLQLTTWSKCAWRPAGVAV